jgi:hypothetical protein
MMVQVKENYQQRGYRKVWDTFLSDYHAGNSRDRFTLFEFIDPKFKKNLILSYR